jgi:hypothetical protein
MANRRQRLAKAKAKKLALALAYQQREERLSREALIRANLKQGVTVVERAWRQVPSSVALVASGAGYAKGKPSDSLWHPEKDSRGKPVAQPDKVREIAPVKAEPILYTMVG